MSDMLSIGTRSLLAFQAAMEVTSANIENARVAYYSRREITFADGMFDDGVEIADISRIYDSFASQNLMQANSSFAMGSFYSDQLTQLSAFLGDDKNNLGTYLKQSQSALNALSTNSGSLTDRGIYLQQLKIMSGRFNALSQQLDLQSHNVNTSLQTVVGAINTITQNLANINQQLINSNGQNNDALLDSREAQIQKLAEYVNLSTTTDANGAMTVMLGNGTPLVVGNSAYALSATANPNNPNTMIIQVATGSGSLDVTNLITGGQISALYQTQATIQQTLSSIGRITLGIMDQFNSQNKLGLDQHGQLGGNIFNDINDPSLATQRIISNVNNTGSESMAVNITNMNALTTSDYKLVFDSSSHYILTRVQDNSVVSSGAVTAPPQQISADGMSINISGGTVAAGDSFIISPTRGAAETMQVNISDPTLLALGWPVDTKNNSQGGSISVTNVLDTTNTAFSVPGQLNPPLTIKFTSATTYDIWNASTNTVMESGITYVPNQNIFPTPGGYNPGYQMQLSGTMQAKDSFDVFYTTNNTSDIRNLTAMSNLYNKSIFENSSLTFSGAVTQFTNMLAVTTSGANTSLQGDKIVKDKAMNNYAQVSQVVVPEETMNLTNYQEAYQASAKIIEVAKEIFDTIIGIGRN